MCHYLFLIALPKNPCSFCASVRIAPFLNIELFFAGPTYNVVMLAVFIFIYHVLAAQQINGIAVRAINIVLTYNRTMFFHAKISFLYIIHGSFILTHIVLARFFRKAVSVSYFQGEKCPFNYTPTTKQPQIIYP